MSTQFIQFKISLNDVQPKIWRRIQVPADYTFWDLHCAIQNTMGWANCHLHGYYMTDKKYGRHRSIRIQMPHPEWTEKEDLDESKELLVNWFPKRLKQCIYTYDFGDTWDHTVLFEKIVTLQTKRKIPLCLTGKNACPPEDCGGSGGYMRLLSVINNPKHTEDQELRDWMGLDKDESYDPKIFDSTTIGFDNPKKALKEYLRDQKMYG